MRTLDGRLPEKTCRHGWVWNCSVFGSAASPNGVSANEMAKAPSDSMRRSTAQGTPLDFAAGYAGVGRASGEQSRIEWTRSKERMS
jgi:hypothetical protein